MNILNISQPKLNFIRNSPTWICFQDELMKFMPIHSDWAMHTSSEKSCYKKKKDWVERKRYWHNHVFILSLYLSRLPCLLPSLCCLPLWNLLDCKHFGVGTYLAFCSLCSAVHMFGTIQLNNNYKKKKLPSLKINSLAGIQRKRVRLWGRCFNGHLVEQKDKLMFKLATQKLVVGCEW